MKDKITYCLLECTFDENILLLCIDNGVYYEIKKNIETISMDDN